MNLAMRILLFAVSICALLGLLLFLAEATPSPQQASPLVVKAPPTVALRLPLLRRQTPKPTPDAEAIYREQMMAWLAKVSAWADAMAASKPDGISDDDHLANLERQAKFLLLEAQSIAPPPRYLDDHEIIMQSMQSCTEALTHYRNADSGMGKLSMSACTLGFTLVADKLNRH